MREYEYFNQFFLSEDDVHRVSDFQREYWTTFFRDAISEEYIQGRVKIGETHARINLPLKTYLVGMNIFGGLFARLLGKENTDATHSFETIMAINKRPNIDASIIVSTYSTVMNKILSDRSKELEAEVAEREKAQAETNKRMKEVEQFNKMAIDRELRMIEMKKEVNELLEKIGQDKKY